MIDRLKQTSPVRAAGRLYEWIHGWARPALLRNRVFGAAIIATLLAALYWGVIASDRYVSVAHVVVQRTELAGGSSVSIGSLLGNAAPNQEDQLLLKDHLLSVDMLQKLDARLGLRAHYSDTHRDLLSRMWGRNASLERFHEHFLSRVIVEFDDFSGVLLIQAQGYDPKTAHAIASALVEEGEQFMNSLAHNLAHAQVTFLERQVSDMQERVLKTRQTVLAFQNENGLVSPQGTAENLAAIVNRIEAQIAELQARRTAMLGYLMPDSAGVVELNLQIGALEKQSRDERRRLAAPQGKTLNRTVEEYQRLELHAQFAQDVYKTALAALESGRVEATRTLKKLSVLQQPFEPQYPIEPRRIYNIVVFLLLALITAGAIQLLAAIVRDHQD
jgi:capsular polysaccharide transport system permease protein